MTLPVSLRVYSELIRVSRGTVATVGSWFAQKQEEAESWGPCEKASSSPLLSSPPCPLKPTYHHLSRPWTPLLWKQTQPVGCGVSEHVTHSEECGGANAWHAFKTINVLLYFLSLQSTCNSWLMLVQSQIIHSSPSSEFSWRVTGRGILHPSGECDREWGSYRYRVQH